MSNRIGPKNLIVAGILFLLPIIAMIILAGNRPTMRNVA